MPFIANLLLHIVDALMCLIKIHLKSDAPPPPRLFLCLKMDTHTHKTKTKHTHK